MAIPSDLNRDHVLKAIADIDSGVSHMFGQSCKYELMHEGRMYSPKAVLGLAISHATHR